MINFSSLSADITTEILSRLPGDSVVRCRHVCKTWRALIDDPSRRIWITFLPADITINILSRLPADSIIQCCRFVCKTWQALVYDPSFVDMHTHRLISSSPTFNLMRRSNNKCVIDWVQILMGTCLTIIQSSTTCAAATATGSSISLFQCAYQANTNSFRLQFVEYNDDVNPHHFRLKSSKPIISTDDDRLSHALKYNTWGLMRISSCNGLVFIGSSKPNVNDVFVCNPFTREYVNLLRNHNADDDGYMVYGFGYHPSSNVYKVVSIYFRGSDDTTPGVVSVYTLGSGSGWRNKGEVLPYKFFSKRPGLLADGAIHWMNKDDDDNKSNIVSFDLADEKFRIVPSPPSSNHDNVTDVHYSCF